MRPRVLYFAVFSFFSLSGGRFTATFLEHELRFSENYMISAAISMQLLASSLSKPWLGGLADSWEASSSKGGGKNGRLRVISLGLLLSTIAILMHGIGALYLKTISSGEKSDTENNSLDIGNMDNPGQASIPLPLLAYHLILRILFSLGTSSIMPALDGLTLVQLEREGVDKQNYGKERMFGALSWGIAHIVFGFALDYFGTYKILYITTTLAFIGCMVTFQVYAQSMPTIKYTGVGENVDSESDSTNDISDSNTKITPCNGSAKIKHKQKGRKYKSKTSFEGEEDSFENDTDTAIQERLTFIDLLRPLFQKSLILNVSFIFSLFALFIGMSVVESLIFLYFEFLGGTNAMFGVTVVVTVMFELPLFHYAPNALKLLGTQKMFLLGCLAYIVRVVGYSFIPQSHPYLVLFFEPLHGVTIAFANTASVDFADQFVPSGYESSGQGFISMIRGLGQVIGLCIGGVLEGRTLYRVLASIVTLGSIILGLGNYLTATKHQQHQLIRKEEEEEPTAIQQPQDQGLQLVEMI